MTPEELAALLAQVEGAEALTDDELADLTEQLRAAAVELLTTEDGVAPSNEAIAQAQDISEKLTALDAISTARQEDADARATQAADLLAQLTASDDDGEDEGEDGETATAEGDSTDDAETEAEVEAESDDDAEATTETEVEVEAEVEPIAASNPPAAAPPAPARVPGRVTRVARRAPDLAPRRREVANQGSLVLRASANVPGIAAGQMLETPEQIGTAFGEALKASQGYRGPRVNIPIATLGNMMNPREIFGEERTLDRDTQRNRQKIEAVTSPAALRASGGVCAPAPIDYSVPIIGTDARPFRDGLARFGADRGGVNLTPPPSLSSMSGAIDTWTHATDTTPGGATKDCLTMTCPSDVETFVDAITTCIKIGNFRQLYWPEQVDAWVKKAAIAAARTAEVKMMTAVGTGSLNVISGTQLLGATTDVLSWLDHVLAGFRSRQRVPDSLPLKLHLPEWAKSLFRADIVKNASGAVDERYTIADTTINAFFTSRNVNVNWVLDGETGQVFGAQADGAILAFPNHLVMYLHVEGDWLALDGGQLNLGVVRDSTLVGTNDFIMFSEFMENVAFHGTESQRIEVDVCPSGAQSLPIAVSCPTAS